MALKSIPRLDERGMVYHHQATRMTNMQREMWRIDVGLIPMKNRPYKRRGRSISNKPVRGHKDYRIEGRGDPYEEKRNVLLQFRQVGSHFQNKWVYEFMPDSLIHVEKTGSVLRLPNGELAWTSYWTAYVPFTPLVVHSTDRVKAVAHLLGLKQWYFDGFKWTSAYDEHRKLHFVFGDLDNHKRTLPLSPRTEFSDRMGKDCVVDFKWDKIEVPEPTYLESSTLKNRHEDGKIVKDEQLGSYSDEIGRL